MQKKIIPIIIPAYEPDERLPELLKNLNAQNIGPVIIVNDGSSEQYKPVFEEAEELIKRFGGELLVHEVNKGKGRALKTAFDYVLSHYPDAVGVVTADSDGQHTPKNINEVIQALIQNENKLVLGVRKFDGDGIPWKSRFGNSVTEKVFKYVSGVHVTDTQTGLRGIPRQFMRELLDVKGERFEFEMRMLLASAGRYDILEIPIETIYDSEENHQTHFHPIKDSIKIYKILGGKFFKYILSSGSSCILDLALFALLCHLLKAGFPDVYIAIATVSARVVSAIYNYIMNYKVVFRSSESVGKSGGKYFLLAVIQMSLSAGLVTLFVKCFSIVPEIVFKIIVDTCLFFVSYYIQQKYVFERK